jgi:organic hydroperoxide reductase OsmC/OhrA
MVRHMAVRAKRFEYAIALDRGGRLSAENCPPLRLGEEWTADHLLLAALARCTVHSLRHHARRAELRFAASAEASGVVTRREEDGRYAFVEIDCAIEAELEPEPGADELKELIFRAERDCFVGATLTVKPGYRWTVNGRELLGEVMPREEPS